MRVLAVLALSLSIGVPLSAQAAVTVAYDHPERFTDPWLDRDHDAKAREAALKGIRQHLEQLGQRYLGNGTMLRIEVIDVDLAGRFSPLNARAPNVRVMHDTDWPRIKLRYTLERAGKVMARREEAVMDMNYRVRPEGRYSNDLLRYEKAMLDEWFRSRFGDPSQAQR
jgi:hypothetical protein